MEETKALRSERRRVVLLYGTIVFVALSFIAVVVWARHYTESKRNQVCSEELYEDMEHTAETYRDSCGIGR